MTDAPNPSAAKTGEPVAWRVIAIEYGKPIGKWALYEVGDWALSHPTLYRAEPLYTHPQPSLSVGLDRSRVEKIVREGIIRVCSSQAGARPVVSAPKEAARVADKILALAAPAEGYVLVPVEPTEAMISAGRDAAQSAGAHYVPWADAAKSTWSAMIAACLPAAPTGGRS